MDFHLIGGIVLVAVVLCMVMPTILPVFLSLPRTIAALRRRRRIRARVSGVSSSVGVVPSNIGADSAILYRPSFTYTDLQGVERRVTLAHQSASFNFEIGSEHEIFIDPELPDVAWMPNAGTNGTLLVMAFLGIIVGLVVAFLAP